MKKTKVSKLFGEFVCDDKILKKYTKRKHFNDYLKTKEAGETLSPATATAIAAAIKNWALSMGATHYTHWFMPLNGKTAEKQVSFVEITSKGEMVEELSCRKHDRRHNKRHRKPNRRCKRVLLIT